MKKLNLYGIVLLTFIFLTQVAAAQVTVSGSTGADGTYTSLTQSGGAFAAINAAGTQAGNNVVFAVTADVLTEDGTNSLNAGDWTTLTISPSGARTISGTVAGALINLDGASNIIIDGLNDGTNSLTISNAATGVVSTIQFINDASNNSITNCTITGSETSTVSAVVIFGSGTSTGNINNTINHCTITAAGTNLPVNGIYSNSSLAGTPNSNNTIADNNIYDFFISTGQSAGVLITNNSPGWTISGNSFYQTATRVPGGGSTCIAIASVGAAVGSTFSGNFIGGSTPACGGTVWNLASTVSTVFYGILVSSGSSTAVNEVQGNTIANINFTTTSSSIAGNFSAISIQSGNANIGTVTGNTIGAATGTGSITISAGINNGSTHPIYCNGTGRTFKISNNIIGAITVMGALTTNSENFRGIYVVNGIATITGNTIGSATTPNSINSSTASTTATTQEVAGINVSGVPDFSTTTITGNTVANLNQAGVGTGHTIAGIKIANILGSNPDTVIIKNNIISNLAGANINTTLASLGVGNIGIQVVANNTSRVTISGNTVSGIANTNIAANGTNVCGIGVTAIFKGSITKNVIYDLGNASTGTVAATPPTVSGILVRSTTLTDTIANNMISLGNGQGTNTEFIGIWNALPNSNLKVCFNSINIEGTAAAGALPSFCLMRGDNSTTSGITSTFSVSSNILVNNRTGGTGSHYAIANNYASSASSATGWSSDYNALNAINAANIGWWSTPKTFAAWKTTSAGDASSLSSITVPFANTAVADLHLNVGVTPTQLESGASATTGITDDIDGDQRPGPAGSVNGGGTTPDIGADEIDAVPLDLTAPVITYTPLTRGICTTGRELTATITDNIAVNVTTGTAPRLYYKKSTDANTYTGNTSANNGWKWVEATNTGNQFTFTIDYSILNGGTVTAGNTIQYFVVAQDMATPNVAINSGTFAATPASVNLTVAAFPVTGTINSYLIANGLSGTVTVGTAGTYTNFTGAAGLFAAINASGLSGNLTASIISNITEPGTTSLTQMVQGCTTYNLTIKPSAPGRVVTAALTSDATLRILSSNVIIDGQSSAAFTRDLTISNTATASPYVVLFGSTGSIPVTNDVLKNCIIIDGANSTTTSYAVVVSDGTTIYSPGYFSNILIQNNIVQKANTGILFVGVTASGNGSGVDINSNIMTTSGTNAINEYGIFLSGIDGASAKYNTLSNFDATDNNSDAGIAVYNCTNSIIADNTISNIGGTGALSGGHGIYITATGSNYNNGLLVYNNSIYGIFGEGWDYTSIPLPNPIGIAMDGNQSGIGIYHNTISLTGNTLTQANAMSMGIYLGTGTSADIRDNIIVNKLGLAAATGYGATAIYAKTGSSQFTGIDYNDYYVNQAGSGVKLLGQIGGTAATTLTAMQAATGQDTYSLNVQPVFISSTNLHLATTGNCALDGYGTPVAAVTNDIDFQARDLGDPDMGFDEFTDAYNSVLANSSYNNTISITKNMPAAGGTFVYTDCNIMADIYPSGGAPLTGEVKVGITRDPTSVPLFYNAAPYVTRHYDIEPVNNASGATASITLYFTDQEFIDYNTNNPLWPQLPTGVLGDSDPNKANIKITQYHGTPLVSPSGPNQYSDGTSTYIYPGASNVVYNGSYWMVSFDVTGFSGFYLYTSYINSALPITLNYLRGTKQGGIHNLNWSVTCNTTPTAILTLERSGDGANFKAITTITATALRCAQPFDYADVTPLSGINYYRLKMTDANGKFSYSNVVTLINATKGLEMMNIAPNPVTGASFKLNVSSAKATPMQVVITDMQGRVVRKQNVSLIAGFNSLDMHVDNLAAGTYNVYGTAADDRTKVIRFVKQ